MTKYGLTNGVNDKEGVSVVSFEQEDERDASLGPLPSYPSQSCDRILARYPLLLLALMSTVSLVGCLQALQHTRRFLRVIPLWHAIWNHYQPSNWP